MKSVLCEMLGIEFPLFAFSHCRNVVAAVSRAGGFGVLGATGFSPDSLEQELKWLDDNIGGKPYGVDVLIPENIATKGEKSVGSATLAERIPQRHRDFVRELLIKYDVEPPPHREVDARARRTAEPLEPAGRRGAGAAEGLVSPSDKADCQRARRAAEIDA